MGWFSDIFSPEVLIPIAAGAFFGPGGAALAKGSMGTAALAGAATGGGIAALKGEDPLMGAVTGGLGGMSGGSLMNAFNPASAAPAASTSTAGTSTGGGLTQAGYEQGLNYYAPTSQGVSGSAFTNQGISGSTFADPFGPGATNQFVSGLPSGPGAGTQRFGIPGSSMNQAGYEQGLKFNPNAPGLVGDLPGGGLTQAQYEQGLNFDPNAPALMGGNTFDPTVVGTNNTNYLTSTSSLDPYGPQQSLIRANSAPPIDRSFSAGLNRLGGEGKYGTAKGAGRLGLMGLGPAVQAGLFETQPMDFTQIEDGMYDPNDRLDLSNDTGLRLIANGGYIGKRNYADGGYLEGGGVPAVMEGSETEVMSTERDGMSDSIAATIDETQPAALSEGEFVVPADVVSFAGNGSSEAGARKFYKMLGDIREASTGQREQIKEIDVEEYMPMSDGIGALA